jgi:hypothetical protein
MGFARVTNCYLPMNGSPIDTKLPRPGVRTCDTVRDG